MTMTIGDFYRAVQEVHTPTAARFFLETYTAYLRVHGTFDGKDPRAVALSNIGWVFGENLLTPDQIAMWRELGAEHPAGQVDQMSVDELVRVGIAIAKRDMAAKVRRRMRPDDDTDAATDLLGVRTITLDD